MQYKTSTIYALPNQINQPLNTAQRARNKVKQVKCHLKASK